ncbi:tetraspanin-4 isoform X15 [Patagioenas fasciata]|uniref:tetraspanin-4 isoform X15 n=1 Tax=Patagioenas fasciata TaxID=372321 RepID=UPI003A98D00D
MVAAERTASRAAQESTRAGRACFRVSRAEWQLGRWERKAAAPAPAVPATERGAAPASPPRSRAGGHLLHCERAFAATRLLIPSWLSAITEGLAVIAVGHQKLLPAASCVSSAKPPVTGHSNALPQLGSLLQTISTHEEKTINELSRPVS